MKRSFTLLLLLFFSLVAYPQSGSRLISHTLNRYRDTTTYFYSGNRGGDMEHTMKYDSAYRRYIAQVNYNNDTLREYRRYYQSFDDQNNIITKITQEGSYFKHENTISNQYKDSNIYDANNNLIITYKYFLDYGVWLTDDAPTIYYRYDGRNNLISERYTNRYLDSFIYDASDHVIQEIYQEWTGSMYMYMQRFTYYYHNDLLDSALYQQYDVNSLRGGWEKGSTAIYDYDSAGYVTRIIKNSVDTGGNLYVSEIDSNVYNKDHDLALYYWFEFSYTNVKRLHERDSNLYDNNHNLVSHYVQNYDSAKNRYIDLYKELYTYNVFSQPTSHLSAYFSDSTGNWIYTDTNYYHYEAYFKTIPPTPDTTKKATLNIYPSPAVGLLYITMKWKQAEEFTVGIVNMEGRLVMQWHEDARTEYKKMIPVSGLAEGNYILLIRGRDTHLSQQFVIRH